MKSRYSSTTSRTILVTILALLGSASCASHDEFFVGQSKLDNGSEGGKKVSGSLMGPSFPTVSVLKKESNVVIVGEVGKVIGRESNDPDKASKFSSPVVINEVRVIQSIKGSLPVGENINVLYWDQEKISIEETSAIKTGQTLLLFLKFYPNGGPGIETVSSYYYPRGQDQGIFDVKDTQAVARSEIVRSVDGEARSYSNNHLSLRIIDVANASEKSRPSRSEIITPSSH